MPSIDLNCDLGESFGAYTIGNDEGVLPFITSANIACGYHAGDPAVMHRSVALCKRYGVQVGAHPACPTWRGLAGGTWPSRRRTPPTASPTRSAR